MYSPATQHVPTELQPLKNHSGSRDSLAVRTRSQTFAPHPTANTARWPHWIGPDVGRIVSGSQFRACSARGIRQHGQSGVVIPHLGSFDSTGQRKPLPRFAERTLPPENGVLFFIEVSSRAVT